ncbi:protein FAR1-RELATED SEQUENCE 5-like [Telopea speciosissima]|uniref:protein FAR1-RELATED SEQUENCE 5-like n=1 Tax=Telopea speciosissima TaxID=54955 RepID=UPI001CC6616E|nr:protein FAR1-RELATED SEQUENCE 5-like [Telopea speciosissima]
MEDNGINCGVEVGFGFDVYVNRRELINSIDMEVPAGPDNEMIKSSVEGEVHQDEEIGKNTESTSGRELVVSEGDPNEPRVGMEFESETAVHAFYSAYADRVGFVIRWSRLGRSRRDRSVIAREFVCNKEGFRAADKRNKDGSKPRATTRVGCKAMMAAKKLSSGKWVISRFVKEHSHPLIILGGRKTSICGPFPSDNEKIRELSQQLLLEKRRSAAFKKYLELLFKHIDEHTESLSKKIQYVVDAVKEVESERA